MRLALWLTILATLCVVLYVLRHPQPWAGLASVPTEQVADLVRVVDPVVVYHRREVPADRNAWPLLLAAIRTVPRSGPGDEVYRPISGISDGVRSLTLQESLEQSRIWDEIFAKIADALKRPECQMPAISSTETSFPYVSMLKKTGKALVERAKFELDGGDGSSAARDLALCHRLGLALRRCEGPADPHFIDGVSICGFADHALQGWITDPHWKAADLRAMLAAWGPMPTAGTELATSLQVEFTCTFLPRLASIRTCQDWWEGVVDPKDNAGGVALDQAVGEIFTRHPRPFDRLATARDSSAIFAECIRDVSRPWARQVSGQEKLVPWRAGWPRSLEDIVGPEASDLRKQLRQTFHNVDNALGKLFTTDWSGVFDGMPMMYFRDRAHWQATRIILASRLYQLEHGGALAPSLRELAGQRYLGGMPIDPYSDKPFLYDPRRKLIWSVGQNGVDDGGKDPPGSSAGGMDMVYALEPAVQPPYVAPVAVRRGPPPAMTGRGLQPLAPMREVK